MPDQNPTDPKNQTQPTVTDAGTTISMPPSDIPGAFPPQDATAPLPLDVPPPPPIIEPGEDSGSAAPAPGAPEEMPKKKFGRGKIIATILGILVLVGGLGAGVILVRQQQLFSQKAATTCSGACRNPPCLQGEDISPGSCSSPTQVCCVKAATPTPTPNPDICNGQCKTDSCSNYGLCEVPGPSHCGPTFNHCCKSCPATPTPACPGGNCRPAPCLDGEKIVPGYCSATQVCCVKALPACPNTDCNIPANTSGAIHCTLPGTETNTYCCPTDKPLYDVGSGKCITTSTSSCLIGKLDCQPDHTTQKCNNNGKMCTYYIGDMGYDFCDCGSAGDQTKCGGTGSKYYCSVAGNNKRCISNETCEWKAPDNCHSDPSCAGTGSPPASAQCLAVKAYDTNWTELTAAQLSALTAGAKVRFTIGGTASSGSFDKAMFKINGAETGEITDKQPATDNFFYEYTIPAGLTTFTVDAKIHHTKLDWSNY